MRKPAVIGAPLPMLGGATAAMTIGSVFAAPESAATKSVTESTRHGSFPAGEPARTCGRNTE